MSTLRSRVANALSFAHLAGIGLRSKAEGDDPEKKDDDKSKKAEGDDPDKKEQDHENGDSKKSKKADKDKQREGESDEDYAARMEEDADADDKGDDKGDDEGDDDEEEMSGNSASAKARRRERARCAAIFASKAAARNPVLAANLAFSTRMTRKEALAVLEGSPAAASAGGSDRSTRNPALGGGGSGEKNSKQAVASGWDAAFAKAAPRRR